MKAVISRQYEKYNEKYEKYFKESQEFKMSLSSLNSTLKEPLVFFDILDMVRLLNSSEKAKSSIEHLEAAAVTELNQLNAQVANHS